MAMGIMELATIARSQDYTTIKHNENNKVMTEQSTIVSQVQKEVLEKNKQVRDSDNTDWHNRKFDAKEKGNGQYSKGEDKKREEEKKTGGKVLVKNAQSSFDIKI